VAHLEQPRPPLGWLAFGVAVQVAFAALVPVLYLFLLSWASAPPGAPLLPGGWWLDALVDLALVVGFSVPHSFLLWPPVRRWLAKRAPSALYGSIFTLAAISALGTMIALWRPLPGVIWAATGAAWWGVAAANALAWGLFVYSMALAGLGDQTGLTPLWYALRGRKPPRRAFAPRSLQRLFRHPIYLSFLLIAWTAPVMTSAHLILSVGFTIYTAVGSVMKDRRLLQYVGEPYRRYMAEVPGYPLVRGGPLGRVPLVEERATG
jgi:protein-S-isoprenylcysteine O-methyltransferase Ste14